VKCHFAVIAGEVLLPQRIGGALCEISMRDAQSVTARCVKRDDSIAVLALASRSIRAPTSFAPG